ncbi:SPX domain-containing membrane protein [Actinidia chinensis var. chinensis]|uniref:SPX domain-containing membrane protein n=1 Tax=Actinidia chinensis var. chinensis TaxID=1590841 RepID=A0A2R6QR75_ACTCC|nr:uncharacterized protein LOC130790649 [Actinidia eriantha]PSS13597.1 SPX domain-containing membrane protein [Actinidia chinensis var. chinensis]
MYLNHHSYPCLHCHPHSYIRMVQHLIERCLLLHMTRDQCIEALAEHARVRPLVTLTVWRELLKENRDFFQMYFHAISPRPFTSRHVQKKSRFGRRRQWR